MGSRYKLFLVALAFCFFTSTLCFAKSRERFVRWGIVGRLPRSFDPIRHRENRGKVYTSALFDSLFEVVGRSFRKQVAEYLRPITSDEYELEIRKGIYFHNGRELTAEDVAFSYEYLINNLPPGSLIDLCRKKIKRLTAVSRYKLKLLTSSVRIDLRKCLLFPILPKEEVMNSGESFWKHPIGSGPYCFYKVTGSRLFLHAYRNYFLGQPRVPGIEVVFFPNRVSVISSLISGKLDYIVSFPCRYIEKIVSSRRLKVEKVKDPFTYTLVPLCESERERSFWLRLLRLLLRKNLIASGACGGEWVGPREGSAERLKTFLQSKGFEKESGKWVKGGRLLGFKVFVFPEEREELWPLNFIRLGAREGIEISLTDDPREATMVLLSVSFDGDLPQQVLNLLFVNFRCKLVFGREVLSVKEKDLFYAFLNGYISDGLVKRKLDNIKRSRLLPLFVPYRYVVHSKDLQVARECSLYEFNTSCLASLEWAKTKRKGVR